MTLKQFLIVVAARWRLALLVWATVLAVTLSVSLLRAPQYTASASVVLDVKSPDPIAGVLLPAMTTSSYMATQVGVMQSERVALRAVDALRLDKDPAMQTLWRELTEGQGDLRVWISDLLAKRLDVMPSRDANIITVAYTSPEPAFAAAVANAYVRAYIDTAVDLRVEPAKQYNSFFDLRAKQLRDELQQAQERLSTYLQRNGIVASDERLDVEMLRLSELSSQLVAVQGVAGEAVSRQAESTRNADGMQEVLGHPLMVELRAELSRQEGRLGELTARLGASHPSVIDMQATVAQLRSRIDDESRRISGGISANNRVTQSRVAQLRSSLEEQRVKVLRLKADRDQAAVLTREVENAQRAYDIMMARAGQSNIESQATQTNVSILKTASVPVQPSSPRVVLNTLVGAVAGLMLALAVVMLRESADRRLRTEDDVLLALRLPVMGSLPSIPGTGLPGRARDRLTAQQPAPVAMPSVT